MYTKCQITIKKIDIKFDILFLFYNYHLQVFLIDKIIYILYHNILIYINLFKFLIKYPINETRLITIYQIKIYLLNLIIHLFNNQKLIYLFNRLFFYFLY